MWLAARLGRVRAYACCAEASGSKPAAQHQPLICRCTEAKRPRLPDRGRTPGVETQGRVAPPTYSSRALRARPRSARAAVPLQFIIIIGLFFLKALSYRNHYGAAPEVVDLVEEIARHFADVAYHALPVDRRAATQTQGGRGRTWEGNEARVSPPRMHAGCVTALSRCWDRSQVGASRAICYCRRGASKKDCS